VARTVIRAYAARLESKVYADPTALLESPARKEKTAGAAVSANAEITVSRAKKVRMASVDPKVRRDASANTVTEA